MREVDVDADRMLALLQVTARAFDAGGFEKSRQQGRGESRRHIAEDGESLGQIGNRQIGRHEERRFASDAHSKR